VLSLSNGVPGAKGFRRAVDEGLRKGAASPDGSLGDGSVWDLFEGCLGGMSEEYLDALPNDFDNEFFI